MLRMNGPGIAEWVMKIFIGEPQIVNNGQVHIGVGIVELLALFLSEWDIERVELVIDIAT